jgi:hypothetical protein
MFTRMDCAPPAARSDTLVMRQEATGATAAINEWL